MDCPYVRYILQELIIVRAKIRKNTQKLRNEEEHPPPRTTPIAATGTW